jgi:uncharacterized YigZ family protein
MSADRYPIPGGRARVEDDVKKSRFIATVTYAPAGDDARAFIESIRREFSDATHNCWAYVVGPPGSTMENGASDDGEPGGTAGRPMLGVLLNSGLGDIAAVVTRYFGGVKLGRGGLVRAYSGAVKRALADLPRAEHVAMVSLVVTLPYAAVDAARRAVATCGARVRGEDFGDEATLTVTCPAQQRSALEQAVQEATAGAARFALIEE